MKRILTFWKPLLVGVVIAAALFLAWAFVPITPNLSRLAIPDGTYDVEILRDTWGVPHVFGRTDADAAFGLAYAHAEDDFLTIQQALVAARGLLGAVYGVDAAPNDFMVGLLRIDERLDAQYESDITPEIRAVLDGYADGINHYAALHGSEVIYAPAFPVTGRDIAAGFVHKVPLFYSMDGVLGELFADERQRDVSKKTLLQPDAGAVADAAPTVPWQAWFSPSGINLYGSNTFAVSPTRSANGETFLAVNSHQPWDGPVAWYEAHVHSEEGLNVVGGLFPGSPAVLVGHNPDLGWAFTVNSPDLIDVYVLEINPDNPDQYRFDGEWRDLEVRQHPIKVKLFGRFRWTVNREVAWSVYGPTVRQPHGVYAVRYAGMDSIDFVETFYNLGKSRDFATFADAVADMPMFNVGYADKAGNIFYAYNGLFPVRTEGYDWTQYLPGDTSDTLWTETIPFAERPQVLNPASGFVQNANSSPFTATTGPGNPDSAEFSTTIGIDTRQSNRALRALALFGDDESITEDEFTTYKFDVGYSADSDVGRFITTLTTTAPPSADLQPAVDLLRAWDLQATDDSQQAALALLTLYFIDQRNDVRFSASEMTESEVNDTALWESLGEAVAWLETHFGRIDVPWGEVNRLVRGSTDLPLAGAPDTLHAIYGNLDDETGRIIGIAGDSYVLLVTWDADGQVRSRSIHQFGSATLREDSPNYADQAVLFAERQLKPVWLDEADIRANLSRAYAPGQE